MRYCFLLIVLLFTFSSLRAQVEPGVKTPADVLPIKADTSSIKPDSVIALRDSSSVTTDSLKNKRKSDIETTINYSAKDSIFSSMDSKMIWLYGDAKIKYGEIELEAEEIIIDYVHNTVTAHGIVDSTGRSQGYPIFKNGAEKYETKDIIYNFKTKRARISEVVTQQGEAYLHSEAVFKNEKGELLSTHNSYTTCNLEHPHFRIMATKTKAIPGDKIVAGPFYIQFNDIPLPIGFLFGMFPAPRKSSSGLIFPSYGEQRTRGFSLRNGGYFFDINDYIKLALTADIYSKGGHALYVRSNYIKRYKYSGSVNFSYSHTRLSEKIEDTQASNDFYLTWSHSPQTKGTGRFSASVNAATSSFNKNNNLNQGIQNEYSSTRLNNTTRKLSSNVSYSKKFANTPFTMGINLSHSQDLVTKIVDLPFPNLTVNMTNIYPFLSKSGKTGPLDNFSIGYSMTASNRMTNNLGRLTPTADHDSIAAFNFKNLGYFFDHARKGIQHTLPMSFSFKMLKFLTVSPSVSYSNRMYFESYNWDVKKDPRTNTDAFYVKDTVKGFNMIGNYTLSAGLTTRLYGTYFFKKGSVKAIRHIVNPSVSFSYAPDYSHNKNYYTPFTTTLSSGKTHTDYKARIDGIYGPSALQRTGSIGFGLGNNLEMKVKTAKDTVARKVSLLNNLSINSSYNFLLDSFKLAPFSIAANTNVLNNLLNVNLSGTLDPYKYELLPELKPGEPNALIKRMETRTKDYAWQAGKIGRITTASLAMSTNLNPKARDKEKTTRDKIGKSQISDADKQYLLANPNAYVDFSIPWGLNISYNLAYTHPLKTVGIETTTSSTANPSITQTVQFSGNLSLSEKWKINFNSGYHFETKEFTSTNISIARDLHCWTMNLQWVPFGRFQSYFFTIHVKAAMLQDLKIDRRKPYLDNL